MTFEEYLEKYKELSEELDRVRKEIKKLEKQGLAPDMEKETSPNLEDYADWQDLVDQEVEVCRKLVKLSDDYKNAKADN